MILHHSGWPDPDILNLRICTKKVTRYFAQEPDTLNASARRVDPASAPDSTAGVEKEVPRTEFTVCVQACRRCFAKKWCNTEHWGFVILDRIYCTLCTSTLLFPTIGKASCFFFFILSFMSKKLKLKGNNKQMNFSTVGIEFPYMNCTYLRSVIYAVKW